MKTLGLKQRKKQVVRVPGGFDKNRNVEIVCSNRRLSERCLIDYIETKKRTGKNKRDMSCVKEVMEKMIFG